jgi:pantothenate kinase type III
VEAVRAGVALGFAGAVERLIGLALAAAGDTARVVLAGGDGGLLAALLPRPVILAPWLTLEGVRLLHARARGAGQAPGVER